MENGKWLSSQVNANFYGYLLVISILLCLHLQFAFDFLRVLRVLRGSSVLGELDELLT
jgi:hypothetical protein